MKKFLCSFLVIFFCWIVAFLHFLNQIPNKNDIYPAPLNADAIVVLTGDNNRIESGLQLFANMGIKYIFISGVAPSSSLEQIVRQYENKDFYLKEAASIELGKKATSTFGNLDETKEWIKDKQLKTIILVTSNYHMPRSYALFKKKLNIDNIIAYPTFSDKFDSNNWWRDTSAVELILTEFHKYLLCKIALFF